MYHCFCFFFLTIGFASAQNTFPATGNVGIGTSSPTEKLHVAGGAILADRSEARMDFPNLRLTNLTGPTNVAGEHRADLYLDNVSGQLVFRNVTQKGYWFADADGVGPLLNIASNGFVGIGTASPQAQLHVVNDAQFDKAAWFSRSGAGAFSTALKLGQTNGSGWLPNFTIATEDNLGTNTLYFSSPRYSTMTKFRRESPGGTLEMIRLGGTQGGEHYMTVFGIDGLTPKIRFSSEQSSYITGNLGVGTSDTKGYKLAVAGNVIAEQVKVKLQGSWPDYVFDSAYQLPSLAETEAFIQKHKRLPGVQPASVIESEGIDIGNAQTILLQKVEELTLHVIALNKKLEQLAAENSAMGELNQQLKAALGLKTDNIKPTHNLMSK